MEEYRVNAHSHSRCIRINPDNDEINELTWRWLQDATTRHVQVSGWLIQRQALKFAADLKIDSFHASNGWLQSFLKRKNIVSGSVNGESDDVDVTVVSDWKSKPVKICDGYEPRDIFNMDETGLNCRDLLDKPLAVKDQEGTTGKELKH